MFVAWLDPHRAVYPRETLYGEQDTRKSVQQQSAAQMASSQDNAIASALGALDISFTTRVGVAAVEKGGPADGKLEPGDIIVSVNGTDVERRLRGHRHDPAAAGGLASVAMTVRRGGKLQRVSLTTTAAPDDPKASAVRVSIQAAGYTLPVQGRTSSSTRTSAAPRPA